MPVRADTARALRPFAPEAPAVPTTLLIAIGRLPRCQCECLIELLIAELDSRDRDPDEEDDEPLEDDGDAEDVSYDAA